MGIVSTVQQAEQVVVDAAVAAGAAVQQAVQAVIQAAPAATPVGTITNEPVVLPATGAVAAAPAPVEVVAPVTAAEPATATEPAPAVVLTKAEQLSAKITALKAKIAADQKKLEQLEALYRSVDLLEGIKAGSVIVAKVGRAETAKEVVATVVGVQTLDSGDKRFKIYYGEGFDADTVVIQESQIVDVKQV